MNKSIHDIVAQMERDYVNGSVREGKYVERSMHQVIETIDAYLSSKHISGPLDSQGREKPFFNICIAVANIYYRATDLDRKNIRIIADRSSNTAAAFLATVLLRDWMNKSRFGVFLNEWGRALSRYGSAVCKFVEKGGELVASVVSWQRLIVDPVDFNASPVIEKFYKTAAQLQQIEEYDQEVVKALIDTKDTRETQDGQKKDNRDDFIEIFEVHGLLDSSYLTDDKEETGEFIQQMHVIAMVSGKDGKRNDYTLYRGREKKTPYLLTHLTPEDGRTLSVGPIEQIFDPQWMVNHVAHNTKTTLDISSKLLFQTADMNYVGRNVLSAIETGDIFVHKENMPLTQVNDSKADISALQAYGGQWFSLVKEISSTPESIRGETLPSGTPYSLGAYLGGQAGSTFAQMTENKGLAVEDMLREYILPKIKTMMDTTEEISIILEDNDISEIDSMYVPRKAIRNFNERFIKELENSISNPSAPLPSPYNRPVEEAAVKESLAPLGNRRFFKPSDIDETTWKEALKDFEMRAVVEITDENTDKAAVLQTLGSVLQSIVPIVLQNPAALDHPFLKAVLGGILKETSVLSPIQLSTASGRGALSTPTAGNNLVPNGTNTVATPTA